MGGNPAGDKFSTGVKVRRKRIFRTKGLQCIKAPKGLQDTSVVRRNDEIIIVCFSSPSHLLLALRLFSHSIVSGLMSDL